MIGPPLLASGYSLLLYGSGPEEAFTTSERGSPPKPVQGVMSCVPWSELSMIESFLGMEEL